MPINYNFNHINLIEKYFKIFIKNYTIWSSKNKVWQLIQKESYITLLHVLFLKNK